MEPLFSYARFLIPLVFLVVVLVGRWVVNAPGSLATALGLKELKAGRVRGQLPGGGLVSLAISKQSRDMGTPLVGEIPGGRLVVRQKKGGEGSGPVLIGDPKFDAHWWVEGDPLIAQAVFSASIRELFVLLENTGLEIHREHFSAQCLEGVRNATWVKLLTEVLPLFSQSNRSLLEEQLTLIFQEDPSESVRAQAFGLLLENGLLSHKLLQHAAHSNIPAVRVPAMIALHPKAPDLEAQLVAMLQDEKFRPAAITGLQRVGTASSVLPLRALTGSRDAIAAIQARVGPDLKGALELAQAGGDLEIATLGGELVLAAPEESAKRDVSDQDSSL